MPFESIEIVDYKDFRKVYDPLPDDGFLKKRIKEIRNKMKSDINKGDFVRRKPYPDKYRKLDVQNLYIYDIGNTHRLIYTIRTDKDHKIYRTLTCFRTENMIFSYSTS